MVSSRNGNTSDSGFGAIVCRITSLRSLQKAISQIGLSVDVENTILIDILSTIETAQTLDEIRKLVPGDTVP